MLHQAMGIGHRLGARNCRGEQETSDQDKWWIKLFRLGSGLGVGRARVRFIVKAGRWA